MQPLEESLGHTFCNTTLLHQALSHPSALAPGQGRDFERLEFLGDRVLGLIIAQWLWEEFPSENEGDLAKRFTGLVRKETLVEVAQTLDLAHAMRMKRERSSSQTKRLETLLADGLEAVIGALYLEGGLEVVTPFIRRYWKNYLNSAQHPPHDPKSVLQEWVQRSGNTHPLYVLLSSQGPAHAPRFIVEVQIEGIDPVQGEGSSKQLAEKDAAQNMLSKINIRS